MNPELYACVWADAHGSAGTLATHEIEHKPYVYTTVGFLVRSDEVGVSIAFEQGEDLRWRDVTFIPRAIVLEEFSLGLLRKPRKTRRSPAAATGEPTTPAESTRTLSEK